MDVLVLVLSGPGQHRDGLTCLCAEARACLWTLGAFVKASSSAPPPSPRRGETARSGCLWWTGWINACSARCAEGARNTGIAIRDRCSLALQRAAPFELERQKKEKGRLNARLIHVNEYSSQVPKMLNFFLNCEIRTTRFRTITATAILFKLKKVDVCLISIC